MKYLAAFVFAASAMFSQSSLSQSADSKYVDTFSLKPVILDSEQSGDTTLGLDFQIDGKLLSGLFDSDEGGGIDADVEFGGYDVSYYLKGKVTENSDNNPEDFTEARISVDYFRSSSSSFKFGGFLKTESDQEFDDRQLVYGLKGTFANIDNFADNDVLAVHVNIGQVDPSEDSAREAVLGSDLDKYERVDFEFLYIYNIGTENLDTFEFNYRNYYEFDADQEISDADLDRFRLVTYRLTFMNNLFVAYSSGELPFNQKDNQIHEIGFSYKFE